MKITATYGDLREVLKPKYGENFSLFVTNTSEDDSFDNLELNLDLTTRITDIGNAKLEFDIEFQDLEFDRKKTQLIRSIGSDRKIINGGQLKMLPKDKEFYIKLDHKRFVSYFASWIQNRKIS